MAPESHKRKGSEITQTKPKRTRGQQIVHSVLDARRRSARIQSTAEGHTTELSASHALRRSSRLRTRVVMPALTSTSKNARQKRDCVVQVSNKDEYEYEEEEEEELYEVEPEPVCDLKCLSAKYIRRQRDVPVQRWFPSERDEFANPRFWTTLQKSFHVSYRRRGVKLFDHRVLNWDALAHAAGNSNVKRHFDQFPGLTALLSERAQYVEQWIRDFYATVWISPDRSEIQFIFEGNRHRLHKYGEDGMLRVLGLEEVTAKSLHNIIYPDMKCRSRRALVGGNFPTDEQICHLFQQPFPNGSERHPDRLTLEAQVIHNALRRSLLPRTGNAETLTSLQQWLLISIISHEPFDILDFLLCEIQDAIYDGISMGRRQPYAHIISYMLSRIGKAYNHTYNRAKEFPYYKPASPEDRRRGVRTMRHTVTQLASEVEQELECKDYQVLAMVDPLLPTVLDQGCSNDNDNGMDYAPPPLQETNNHVTVPVMTSVPEVTETTPTISNRETHLIAIIKELVVANRNINDRISKMNERYPILLEKVIQKLEAVGQVAARCESLGQDMRCMNNEFSSCIDMPRPQFSQPTSFIASTAPLLQIESSLQPVGLHAFSPIKTPLLTSEQMPHVTPSSAPVPTVAVSVVPTIHSSRSHLQMAGSKLHAPIEKGLG